MNRIAQRALLVGAAITLISAIAHFLAIHVIGPALPDTPEVVMLTHLMNDYPIAMPSGIVRTTQTVMNGFSHGTSLFLFSSAVLAFLVARERGIAAAARRRLVALLAIGAFGFTWSAAAHLALPPIVLGVIATASFGIAWESLRRSPSPTADMGVRS